MGLCVCVGGFCNVWVCVSVGLVMCGFCNVWDVCLCVYMWLLVICVLAFTVFCIIVCTVFLLFRLCIFIVICFVCTSVRTTATG